MIVKFAILNIKIGRRVNNDATELIIKKPALSPVNYSLR